MNSLSATFNDKKVLITGHTGFKGSWLSAWLSQLGANVIGLSDRVPTEPAHYNLIKDMLDTDLRVDVKEADAIFSIINEIKPDFIFHLAAQPIVLESYNNPLNTFNTNVIGTGNVLDALRRSNHQCTAVMITSDKCYDNVEWTYGYRETDRLGGKDPYSGSKGAAELVIRSYVESFFKISESNIRIGIGRAGNVIGGGDWAPFRIIPDCVRAWSKNEKPGIRSPLATRPWQHVLEPLSGYISLACALSENDDLNGEAFNFGPPAHQNHTVKELVDEIATHWEGAGWLDKSTENHAPHEAGLLKLNCDKALNILGWQSTMNFKETAKWTGEWYNTYYKNGPEDANLKTLNQINDYMALSLERDTFRLA
ncbi:MAG: CDP-glucose 4,6-dehydratase [Bacteroidetes bacterium]|nr:CDP-glucose 4,6-dehydratase [Bacteroidota bacterium]